MLQRKSPELLLLAVACLKKLKIYAENKDEMREVRSTPKPVRSTKCSCEA